MAELEPLLADPSGDIFGDEDNDSEIATSKQAPAADSQPVDTLTLGAAISDGDDEDLLAELEVDGDGDEDEGEGDGNGGAGNGAGTGAGGASSGDGGGGGSGGAEGSSGNAVGSTSGTNAGDGVAATSTPPTGPTTASPLDNGESLDMSDGLDSGAAGSTGTTKLGDGSGSGGDTGGGTAGGLGAGSANTGTGASTSAGTGTGTGTGTGAGTGTGTGGDSSNAGGSKSPLTLGGLNEIEAEASTSSAGSTPPATQTQVTPSTDSATTGAGGDPGAGPGAGAGPGSTGAIGAQQAARSTVTEAETARASALAKVIKTSAERGVALPAPSGRTVSDARAAAEQAGLCPGVSLTILLELVERMQAYNLDPDVATFEEVLEKVIKADIQADTSVPADERNYSDFVRAIDPALVGAPHFYVSHAWGSVFANTVSDVQNFVQMWMADRFEPDPNDPDSWQERVYVWVDVLCRKPKQDAAAVVQEARHAIAWASELTLASIDDDCDVFQLAWMQYEAWCTAEVKGADKLRLLCPQVLTAGHVKRNLGSLDPSTARCLQPEHHHAILRDLRDRQALQQFRPVLVQTLMQASAAEAGDWSTRTGYEAYYACALHKCGVFVQAAGTDLLSDAEVLHKHATDIMEQSVGANEDPIVRGLAASNCIGVAEVLMSKREWQQAEAQFRLALVQQEEAMGAEHPDTLRANRLLAQVLKRQRKWDEAEAIYRRLLPAYANAYGQGSKNYATGLLHLAVLLSKKGGCAESARLAEQALGIYDRTLGEAHATTLQTLVFLKRVARKVGDREAWLRWRNLLKERGGSPAGNTAAAVALP